MGNVRVSTADFFSCPWCGSRDTFWTRTVRHPAPGLTVRTRECGAPDCSGAPSRQRSQGGRRYRVAIFGPLEGNPLATNLVADYEDIADAASSAGVSLKAA